ncbi:hypothetical protein D3C87_1692820 [compost metagenome]
MAFAGRQIACQPVGIADKLTFGLRRGLVPEGTVDETLPEEATLCTGLKPLVHPIPQPLCHLGPSFE